MVKAIIFDADGPLYFRKPKVIEAQLELLNRYGYPGKLNHQQAAHLNKYGHLGSLHDFDAAYEVEKFKGYVRDESVPVMVRHILHTIGLNLTGTELREFTHELKALHEQVSPVPGAADALKQLKELGYRTCVLTDSFYSSEEKWGWFRAMGLAGLLDHMVSSYDIRVLKDTPQAYRACLELLGVSAGEVIFVGHQEYEMIGAKAAGIKSVAVMPIASPDISCDYEVNSLGELPSLLARINNN